MMTNSQRVPHPVLSGMRVAFAGLGAAFALPTLEAPQVGPPAWASRGWGALLADSERLWEPSLAPTSMV